MADSIQVEVVFAGSDRQWVVPLTLPPGTTALQAFEQSGLLCRMGEGEFDAQRLGIFSRRVAPDTVLADGDRVEAYRPLTLDPKEARRRRAREG